VSARRLGAPSPATRAAPERAVARARTVRRSQALARGTQPLGPRALALVLALALAACASFSGDAGQATYPTPPSGAVASEHPLATEVGLAVLERGGNAADAAVATALALAVVYPQAGNLGGGGFALWVPHAGGEPAALDFREVAPGRLTAESYHEGDRYVSERSKVGHLAAGVPGTPYGLWELHRRFGELAFAELVAPAVELAREGFRVDPWLAHHLQDEDNRAKLVRWPAARNLFYPAGRALREGDLLEQPELARTLERYARQGPAGFYRGPVARAIAGEMVAGEGLITLKDLDAYRVRWPVPLRGWFRGYEVIAMPPPSSGGVVMLQVLKILDGLPLDAERRETRARYGESDPPAATDPRASSAAVGLGARAVHWWIEALRRGFADRAEHLGDPEFHDVPVDALLSPRWIAERRISIGEDATPDIGPWSGLEEARAAEAAGEPGGGGEGETTHVSVLDDQGNAVSLTTTLNGFFGCGVMVPQIGVLLNNEMDDFSVQPGVPNEYGLVGSEANSIRPGKRPLSSMTPTVIRQGGHSVTLVVGSPGGPRIITAVVQVLLRVLVYGQDLEAAIRAPRLHQQWRPRATYFEAGWDPALLRELERRGHALEVLPPRRSSVQAILLEPGAEPDAFSDARRGGVAGVQGRPLPAPSRP